MIHETLGRGVKLVVFVAAGVLWVVAYAVSFIARIGFLVFRGLWNYVSPRLGKPRTIVEFAILHAVCVLGLGLLTYRQLLLPGTIPALGSCADKDGTCKFPWITDLIGGITGFGIAAAQVIEKWLPTATDIPWDMVAATGAVTFAALFATSVANRYGAGSRQSLLYAVCLMACSGITLGFFAYLPFAQAVGTTTGLLAWVMGLFVGNIEEFAVVVTELFDAPQYSDSSVETGPEDHQNEGGTFVYPMTMGFNLARGFALGATVLSLLSVFATVLSHLRKSTVAHIASCVDVVIGDDVTALRLAKHLAVENKEKWRFHDWHSPDLLRPFPHLFGGRQHIPDFDRVFGRPRKVVLIVSNIDAEFTKRAEELGVLVTDLDPTDLDQITGLVVHRPILLRNLVDMFPVTSLRAPRRVRLRRMYVVGDNPERNADVIAKTRTALHAVNQERRRSSSRSRNKAMLTTHGAVPRVVLRLDNTNEARSWVERQLEKYDEDGVPWLMDSVNSEEASAASIRARLTYNPDRDTTALADKRFNKEDTQHVVVVGSSPLSMAMVDEMLWARWQAYEQVRAEIRCYTRLIEPLVAENNPTTEQVTQLHRLERAKDLRTKQLHWLLCDDPKQFAKYHAGEPFIDGDNRPAAPHGDVDFWPYEHSRRLEIPAVKSIRMVGCDEHLQSMLLKQRAPGCGVQGLEDSLGTLEQVHSTGATSQVPILFGEQYSTHHTNLTPGCGPTTQLLHRHHVTNSGPAAQLWLHGSRIDGSTARRVTTSRGTSEQLQEQAEEELRHLLGLPHGKRRGRPRTRLPEGEQVLVVFTEETTWSRAMARVIMSQTGNNVAVLVKDSSLHGIKRADADGAYSRFGPTWVSRGYPIEDMWTRQARQHHNASLSLYLDEVPQNAYGKVPPTEPSPGLLSQAEVGHWVQQVNSMVSGYRAFICPKTADEARGSASRLPWHGSPYLDRPENQELGTNEAHHQKRPETMLQQLPEFFREEQLHVYCRIIMSIQDSHRFTWAGVRHPEPATNALAPVDLKELVVKEHRGWVTRRAQYGWKYGETRSDYGRIHPHMTATYDDLDVETQKRLAWLTFVRVLNRMHAIGLAVVPEQDDSGGAGPEPERQRSGGPRRRHRLCFGGRKRFDGRKQQAPPRRHGNIPTTGS